MTPQLLLRAGKPIQLNSQVGRENRSMPVVGERNATRWLATQPRYTSADTRFTEAARSGDLGYTMGTYIMGPQRKPTQQGFYVRIWARARNGQWTLAMDILQPQP